MTSPVILPKLTYEMQEGRIIEWLAAEGEQVSPGQVLFTVETDKAAVEVPAEEPGVLLKILVRAGETVPVSTAVAWVGTRGEVLPESGTGPLALGDVGIADRAPAAPRVAGPAPLAPGAATEEVLASPIARRMARELGLDLRDVQVYSGQKRVREADVQAYADAQKALSQQPKASVAGVNPGGVAGVEPAPLAPPAPPTPAAPFELVRLTPLQKAMAARMSQAAVIPQMAAACDVDLAALEQLKTQLGPGWEAAQGFHLTYTHLMAALIARAAGVCPGANASWTEEGIRFYRDVNLGIAMASERGLVVPVVCDAGRRPLREIAAEIIRLQHAAKQNRLPAVELEGGTITMSNVGMLGIALSIPLLNPPQSAIVAVGARREQVMFESMSSGSGQGNEIRMKPVLTVTVVADHRVMDGVAVAAFLGQIKQLMEHPHAALGLETV